MSLCLHFCPPYSACHMHVHEWHLSAPSISPFFPSRLFRFNDEDRGKVTFTGNVLFTHFGEIDYNPFPQPTHSSNNELDTFHAKSGGPTLTKNKHASTFA